jgi:hypothetical protein
MGRSWEARIVGWLAALCLVSALANAASAHAERWVRSPMPIAPTDQDRVLFSASGARLGDVWAVGRSIDGYSQDDSAWEPLIMHRHAGHWEVVPGAPSHHDLSALFGVAAASPRDVWAAGIDFADDGDAMLEHWNGARWTRYPTSGINQRLNAITQIRGIDQFALVGGFTGSRQIAGFERDGTWTFTRVPTPHRSDITLSAVVGLTPNDVWAFGSDSDHDAVEFPGHAFASHWDGDGWTRQRMPKHGGLSGPAIYDATAVPHSDDLWVVGQMFENRGSRFLTYRFDGTSWTHVHAPRVPDGYLSGVTARGPYDVWASGSAYDPATHAYDTVILHYDHNGWQTVPAPSPGTDDSLRDITSAGGQLWAVGDTRQGEEEVVAGSALAVRRR